VVEQCLYSIPRVAQDVEIEVMEFLKRYSSSCNCFESGSNNRLSQILVSIVQNRFVNEISAHVN
jgi:hypothetical protein